MDCSQNETVKMTKANMKRENNRMALSLATKLRIASSTKGKLPIHKKFGHDQKILNKLCIITTTTIIYLLPKKYDMLCFHFGLTM